MANAELLRVVSDLDGVIAHHAPPILDAFNQRFGTNLTYADWTAFDLITTEAVRLSNESPADIAAWLYSSEIMARSDAVQGVKDAICVLASLKMSPEIITSRPANQTDMTRQWIKAKLPDVGQVYIRGNKHSTTRGDDFKIQLVSKLKANVYIEDDPSVTDAVSRLVIDGRLPHLKLIILVDRPWNDKHIILSVVQRVGSWREEDYGWNKIVEILKDLMGGT